MDEVLNYVALANALLFVAFLVCFLLEAPIKQSRFRRAYPLRLNLAGATLCAASLPLLMSPLTSVVSSALGINGTDLAVSFYLQGNLDISATQLAAALDVKNDALTYVTGATSTFSIVLIAIFLAAAFLRSLYIAINIYRARMLLKNSKPLRKTRRVNMWVSDRIAVPLSTRGFWRHHIIVPLEMADNPRSLRIAIGHEAQHIRQGDVTWEIVLSLVSPIFVLNPGFWFVSHQIRRFREYNCDANFLRRGTIAPREYCLTLLAAASREVEARTATGRTSTFATSVPFFGRDGFFDRSSRSALKRRVLAVAERPTGQRNRTARYLSAIPAAVLMIAMIGITVMSAKPSDWSQDRLMLSTVVNLERLDRINGFGERPW